MASASIVLRTCGLLFCFIISIACDTIVTEPRIVSVTVRSKSCVDNFCKYLLNVRGSEFLGHLSWRLTPVEGARGSDCNVTLPDYELHEIETTQWHSSIEVSIPVTEARIFFCLYDSEKRSSAFGGKWVHQGVDQFLDPRDASDSEIGRSMSSNAVPKTETSRLQDIDKTWVDISHDTDVNFNSIPTRDKRTDIQILVKNVKDPYGFRSQNSENIKSAKSPQTIIDEIKENNMLNRKTRAVNATDSLITSDDIIKAKMELENDVRSVKKERKEINDDSLIKIRKERDSGASENETLMGETDNADSDSLKSKMREEREIENKSKNKLSHDAFENINEKETFKAESAFPGFNSFQEKKRKKRGTKNIIKEDISDDTLNLRRKREAGMSEANALEVTTNVDRQLAFPGLNNFEVVKAAGGIQIDGLRIEESTKEPVVEDGIPSVLAESKVTLRLYGEGLTSRTVIALTYAPLEFGQPCKFLVQGYEYMVKEGSLRAKTALFDITTPPPANSTKLYICAKNLKLGVTDPFKDEEKYIHQGTEEWKVFSTHTKLMPLWVAMILILTCLTFSALFSGLNLGLMSLDRTELKIIANTGTEQERKYARAIMPVRDHGNYLLCSILLGNVAVNSTFTILLDELTSGLFAVIFSTLAIVLLGEITPQAICSRHGLMVGAKSIVITKAVMAVTAPLAYPVSKILDYLLGEEIGNVYNRERLKELVKVTTGCNDLDKDEVNIISGALELRKKFVEDIMTKLEDVFMLPITSVLDFETMSEIVKSGFSRIPVYEGQRGNIVTVLFIKDLAFVDPDDNTPLRTLCQYYQNPCNFVFEDVTLDVMFKQFKEGHKGHMAFVHRINSEGEGDPFYETIGLVTLEDVIEEMIQAEIVDETDVFMDNRTKRRRNRPQNKLQDFAAFAERHENQRIHISPQLTLATFQFLSTSVDVFRPDVVSETVLRRLLRQDVIQYIKMKGKAKKDVATYVYQQGKPVDYFVLVLEGRVEVTVGRENLVFEAGPFTYFGVQALAQNMGVAESPTPSVMGSLQNINMDAMLRHTFVPDYSVRATTDLYYLTVKRTLYLAAKRATLMEKGALSKGATNEQFDTEVDKLLQSVDEDMSISGDNKTPSRQVSPNPLPVSASPLTRATFARTSPEPRNEIIDEQEKLLK